MNKYQEALKHIEDIYYGTYQGYINENDVLAIQELVNKETPMKPNGDRCGRCGMAVKIWAYEDMEITLNRCRGKHCGQVVDWT